jgi:hypothetical protein
LCSHVVVFQWCSGCSIYYFRQERSLNSAPRRGGSKASKVSVRTVRIVRYSGPDHPHPALFRDRQTPDSICARKARWPDTRGRSCCRHQILCRSKARLKIWVHA